MDASVSKKIADFFSQYRKQTYKKGEMLIRADEIPSAIFYIESGLIRKYAISQKGEELVVNVFKPTAFIPISWAINDTPNKYYYEALEESVVRKAPKDALVSFISSDGDVLYDLIRKLYRGLEGMTTRMAYLMAGNAYGRLLTEIVIHAKRFGKQGNADIEITVSETELAAESGMTRETVSREMKLLKEKGLVTFSKNMIHIPDLSKLERELSGGV